MQNDMRDRLVELLNFVPCKAECCSALDGGRYGDLDNLDRCQIETIADHLIANGVIVPPCKEHDLVYDLVLCDDGKYRIFDMRVGKVVTYGSTYNGDVWNVYLIGTYTYAYRSFYDFGKTVFLTKAQAEQKLKELRVENG